MLEAHDYCASVTFSRAASVGQLPAGRNLAVPLAKRRPESDKKQVDLDPFHFPPDVHQLLIEVIPRICKYKLDVITFFQGAGCDDSYLDAYRVLLSQNPQAFRKPLVCRNVLTKLNERGEGALRLRREVVKRVCEFEDYSTCWPDDVLKAKGLVAELRRLVNVKDSFTRIRQEREREREANAQRYEAVAEAKRKRVEQLASFARDLAALAVMTDALKRGKALENLLNAWFKAAGIGIREAFTVRVEGVGVVEQIDGLVKFDGHLYLVEMKWRNEPLGVAEVGQHFARVAHREARGILISASGFTAPAVEQTRQSLSLKVFVLCELAEFVALLERRGELKEFLDKKVDAAIGETNPLFRPG
jgi:hypothetical protein